MEVLAVCPPSKVVKKEPNGSFPSQFGGEREAELENACGLSLSQDAPNVENSDNINTPWNLREQLDVSSRHHHREMRNLPLLRISDSCDSQDSVYGRLMESPIIPQPVQSTGLWKATSILPCPDPFESPHLREVPPQGFNLPNMSFVGSTQHNRGKIQKILFK